MAEITTKRTGELVRKAFEVMFEHPDGLQAKDVLAEVANRIELTEFEKSYYPNNPHIRRFEKILRFSTIAPVKAGWMVKSKGIWTVTEEGQKAYKEFTDPEKFRKEAVRLYKQWASNQPDDESDEEVIDTDASEAISTLEEAEENAWSEIQEHLQKMPPYDFQNLVAALLSAMDYHVSWVSPPGPDGGLDILAYTDPLGTRPPRIKVQVKRNTSQKVTVEGLRAFMALLGDEDVGIFVAVGGFTKDAENEARTQEKRRITLINLERLFDLWVEHYDAIPEQDRKMLPLKPVYFYLPQE